MRRMKPTWQAGESFESSGLSWDGKAETWSADDGTGVTEGLDDGKAEEGVTLMAPNEERGT